MLYHWVQSQTLSFLQNVALLPSQAHAGHTLSAWNCKKQYQLSPTCQKPSLHPKCCPTLHTCEVGCSPHNQPTSYPISSNAHEAISLAPNTPYSNKNPKVPNK
ncbi:hypothetical protein V8G54_004745 [Vigna mungo]|uniref:Uncharacterized protein n=1 Tax=Vigna mungo TaxID=3915 RepID=A0AAQ3PCA0_VIGMU